MTKLTSRKSPKTGLERQGCVPHGSTTTTPERSRVCLLAAYQFHGAHYGVLCMRVCSDSWGERWRRFAVVLHYAVNRPTCRLNHQSDRFSEKKTKTVDCCLVLDIDYLKHFIIIRIPFSNSLVKETKFFGEGLERLEFMYADGATFPEFNSYKRVSAPCRW